MPTVAKKTKREPLLWPYEDDVWTLLPAPAGVVPFMEPDDKGRIGPPTSETFDQFLAVVIDPGQAADLLAAAKSDDLPAPERFDMAVAAWKNTMRYTEIENAQAQQLALLLKHNEVAAEAIQKTKQRLQEEKTAAQEAAQEDDAAPLDEG